METHKGHAVVEKLDVVAVSNNGKNLHSVYIVQAKTLRNDPYLGLCLSIDNAPGMWYVQTLMNDFYEIKDKICLDGGSKWYVENYDKVHASLLDFLEQNKAIFDMKFEK